MVSSLFSQIELLPIAYLLILLWVVCATVSAKLLAPVLVNATTGTPQRILSQKLNIQVTGDIITLHLFEEQALKTLNTRLLFDLVRDLARLAGGGIFVPVPTETHALQKILVPECYWSGCPPN